jgi:hypothetical protein
MVTGSSVKSEQSLGNRLLTGKIDRPSTRRVELVWGCLNNPSRLE